MVKRFKSFGHLKEPLTCCDEKQEQSDHDIMTHGISRRSLFSAAGTIPCILAFEDPVYARDELYRPNPLTNPFLEQVRLKYGMAQKIIFQRRAYACMTNLIDGNSRSESGSKQRLTPSNTAGNSKEVMLETKER